jgi:DNA gyrase subunit A
MQQREDNKYLCMVTKNGVIKRTELEDFENIRKTGLIALSLDDDDELHFVRLTSGNDELVIATRSGRTLRFDENDVRPMGRTARGVRAIKLSEDEFDAVVGMAAVRDGETLLTVSERGMGRRTPFEDYPQRSRGGKGVTNYNTEKLGPVAGVKSVSERDDVVLISDDGVVIRIPSGDVSQQSRYAGGVRVMRLAEGTRLVTLAAVAENDEEELSEAEVVEAEEASAAEAVEE